MKKIDAGTVREMFRLADEQYETAQLNTINGAYELNQVRHDDLIQFVLVRYRVDPDTNMSEQSRALSEIEEGELFSNAADAREGMIEKLMQAPVSVVSY